MSILDLLKDKKVIKQGDIASIEDEAKGSGLSLEQVLVSRGVSPEQILEAKGSDLDIPTRSLKDLSVAGKVLAYIPQENAEHYKVIPLGVKDGMLEVGIVNPDD